MTGILPSTLFASGSERIGDRCPHRVRARFRGAELFAAQIAEVILLACIIRSDFTLRAR